MRKNIQSFAIFRQQFPTCCLNIGGGILKTYSQISNLKEKRRRKTIATK
jgi:hypothetical protein